MAEEDRLLRLVRLVRLLLLRLVRLVRNPSKRNVNCALFPLIFLFFFYLVERISGISFSRNNMAPPIAIGFGILLGSFWDRFGIVLGFCGECWLCPAISIVSVHRQAIDVYGTGDFWLGFRADALRNAFSNLDVGSIRIGGDLQLTTDDLTICSLSGRWLLAAITWSLANGQIDLPQRCQIDSISFQFRFLPI